MCHRRSYGKAFSAAFPFLTVRIASKYSFATAEGTFVEQEGDPVGDEDVVADDEGTVTTPPLSLATALHIVIECGMVLVRKKAKRSSSTERDDRRDTRRARWNPLVVEVFVERLGWTSASRPW
jgi:hypothetical protein